MHCQQGGEIALLHCLGENCIVGGESLLGVVCMVSFNKGEILMHWKKRKGGV